MIQAAYSQYTDADHNSKTRYDHGMVQSSQSLMGSDWGQQNTHLYQFNFTKEWALKHVDHTNNSSYTLNKNSHFLNGLN